MRNSCFYKLRNEKGQATVELAISLLLLMLLIFGIVDFGRIFAANLNLQHTTSEAVRTASLGGTDEDVIQTINKVTSLNRFNLKTTVSPSYLNRTSGEYVTVTSQYSIDIIFPLISNVVPNPFILTSKKVMRVE